MGVDFSSHWIFTGNESGERTRNSVIEVLQQTLLQAGYRIASKKRPGDRDIVIGPPGRWIWIGDSASHMDLSGLKRFASLSQSLSKLAPVVDLEMGDSVEILFSLYRQGCLVDAFRNEACFSLPSETGAAQFLGKADLWADFLRPPFRVENLRSIWIQGGEANEILTQTVRLLGFDPELSGVGYTIDYDGIPEKYIHYLGKTTMELEKTGFSEFHFKWAE
jgi:hypothetical protein